MSPARWSHALRVMSGDGPLLLARAAIDLALMYGALRLRGFQRVMQGVPVVAPGAAVADQVAAVRRARRYARIIATASRWHPLPVACLPRSLVLHRWLRGQGLPSDLRIGVQRAQDELKAHAWVQFGNVVLNDEPDAVQPFAPLSAGPQRTPSAAVAFDRPGIRAESAGHDR